MLASSLPTNGRFDHLRGLVDTGMDCVKTPEKVVEMAITFDNANKADSHLTRSFGNGKPSSDQSQQVKHQGGGRGGKRASEYRDNKRVEK